MVDFRCSGCVAVWRNASRNEKAQALDAHVLSCGCEVGSLQPPAGEPVKDSELIVRVLTSPDGMDADTGEILTRRLTALFSSGVSVIREGASDDEIRLTVRELTSAAEPQRIVGCVLVRASAIRHLDPNLRAYCIYDTPDGSKERHADILCTMPTEPSRSQQDRRKEARRRALRDLFQKHTKAVASVEELISIVRAEEARSN